MIENHNLSILLAGAVLLLASIKLANPLGINKKGNFYFGLFLLLYSSFWLDDIVIIEASSYHKWIEMGKSIIQFLVPILFFISVKFYTEPRHRFNIKDVMYFIPLLLFVVILLCEPAESRRSFNILVTVFTSASGLLYTVLSYRQVLRHQQKIESFISNKEPIDLNWIKYIIYSFIGSTIIYICYAFSSDSSSLNIYMNLYFFLIVNLIAYFSIKQGEIFPHSLDVKQLATPFLSEEGSSTKALMDDEQLNAQKEHLIQLMNDEKPYLDTELNLLKLADQMSLSAHQLSYIVNKGFGENFFSFINRYKVENAKKLLQNPDYDHYTILAIAYESGFNSKTAFNTTFKKLTDQTPSEFRKLRSIL